MDTRIWSPVSFAPAAGLSHESVYLDGDGFLRRPIIGVLIEDEVAAGPDGRWHPTGVRRSVMAEQADSGSADIEGAGGSVDFVGVFEVGQEPSAELVRRARNAMEALDRDLGAPDSPVILTETWPSDDWTGPVRVVRRRDLLGDAVLTLPAAAIARTGDQDVDVTVPMELMRWATDPV